MSEQEQQERVTERAEPLADTQARLETTLRTKGVRLVLLGLLALGGLGTAHETGALGLLVPAATKHSDDDMRDVKRLLSWLVRQERNRQVKDCLAQPSVQCHIEEPPDPEAEK
jgi:hypothetical protein